jgi:hypothetical protein
MTRKSLALLVAANLCVGSLGCDVQPTSTSSTNPGGASGAASEQEGAGSSAENAEASLMPQIREQADTVRREHAELSALATKIQNGQLPAKDIDGVELQKKVDAFTAKRTALTDAMKAANAQDGLSYKARIELTNTEAVTKMEVPGQITTTLKWFAENDNGSERAAEPPESAALQAIAVRSYAGTFAIAHPARFRFLNRKIEEGEAGPVSLDRPLAKGEPVLVLERGDISSNVTVVAVDGNRGIVRAADLASKPLPETTPHPLRAEWLLIERERPASNSKSMDGGGRPEFVGGYWSVVTTDDTGFRLEDAPFLPYADDSTPAVQDFVSRRAEVVACYDAEMKRLDPDDNRRKFDQVTFRNGKPVKVERLTTVYDKKACKKCGCKAFNERKRKLAGEVIAPMQKQRYDELRADIDRLNELFAR